MNFFLLDRQLRMSPPSLTYQLLDSQIARFSYMYAVTTVSIGINKLTTQFYWCLLLYYKQLECQKTHRNLVKETLDREGEGRGEKRLTTEAMHAADSSIDILAFELY